MNDRPHDTMDVIEPDGQRGRRVVSHRERFEGCWRNIPQTSEHEEIRWSVLGKPYIVDRRDGGRQ